MAIPALLPADAITRAIVSPTEGWVKRLLDVVAGVDAATAEGVIASLGGTCKVPPIRTKYPEGASAGKLAFPTLCRAEWRFLTPKPALGAGTTSDKRVMEATFADYLLQAIGSDARAKAILHHDLWRSGKRRRWKSECSPTGIYTEDYRWLKS